MGIFLKSWRIATRNKRRFFGFVVVYSMLALAIATSLKQYFEVDPGNYVLLAVTVAVGIVLSTMYGLILTTFRKREIATLKAIGWSNGNVLSRIFGEILFLSLIGFFILIELDIHILGTSWYIFGLDPVRLAEEQIVRNLYFSRVIMFCTFLLIVGLQIPGVYIANRRALQVKPMIAMRSAG